MSMSLGANNNRKCAKNPLELKSLIPFSAMPDGRKACHCRGMQSGFPAPEVSNMVAKWFPLGAQFTYSFQLCLMAENRVNVDGRQKQQEMRKGPLGSQFTHSVFSHA